MPDLSLNANRRTKHTPAGEIPVDWGCVMIGNIAKILSGGTPSRKESRYWNGVIPWIKTAELQGGLIKTADEFITEEGLLKSSAKIIPSGTILIALYEQGKTRGQVGLLCFDAAINQASAAIILKSEVNTLFLFNYLRFRYHNIRNLSNTGSQENLNANIIKNLPIPLPPLSEQRKIAEILSTWDTALEKLDALIRAKKQQKKALMQQLLTGRKRLPGFRGNKEFFVTFVGETPTDWLVKRLGEVFLKIRRKNNKGVKTVLTASGESGLINQRTYFTKSVASKNLTRYYLLRRGEFAYNRSAMNRYPYGAIKRLDQFDEGVLSTLYSCFALADNDCDSDFYTEFFEAGIMNRQLRAITQVGGRAHGLLNISDSDFFNLEIPVPSISEQIAIAQVLKTAENEISKLEFQRKALGKQKRGLMQRLLTGKVRVNI